MADDLREWADKHVPALALKAMAEDMPGVHAAKKADVLAWLLDNDPEVLAESRRVMDNARSKR